MKSGPIRRDDGEGGRLIAVYVVSGSEGVVYVGASQDPVWRLKSHEAMARAQVHTLTGWPHWLLENDYELRVLEWVPESIWRDVEAYWIEQMRAFGCNLLNADDRRRQRLGYAGRRPGGPPWRAAYLELDRAATVNG